MKPLSAKKLIVVLESNGFLFSRSKGSHMIYINSRNGAMVPVPLHGLSRPIPIGTFLSIVKQSRLPKKEFGE